MTDSAARIQQLSETYLATIGDNLQAIDGILQDLGIGEAVPLSQFQEALQMSAGHLVRYWQMGRKVLRTRIAQEMIPGYPASVLNLSLMLDATINVLDDLLDELLTKEEKGIYILEMARILAIYNQLDIPAPLRERIAAYFNKCICIVLPEIVYKERLKATRDFDRRLVYAEQCYDSKSLDMDIFVELPLLEMFGPDVPIQGVVSLARVHRAVSLLHKDLADLEHDRTNHTETPLVILAEEGEEQLRRYLQELLARYRRRSEQDHRGDGNFAPFTRRIQAMIREEIANLTQAQL